MARWGYRGWSKIQSRAVKNVIRKCVHNVKVAYTVFRQVAEDFIEKWSRMLRTRGEFPRHVVEDFIDPVVGSTRGTDSRQGKQD